MSRSRGPYAYAANSVGTGIDVFSATYSIFVASIRDSLVPYFTSIDGDIFASCVPAPLATVSGVDALNCSGLMISCPGARYSTLICGMQGIELYSSGTATAWSAEIGWYYA